MNIAFILYDGLAARDLLSVFGPMTRLDSLGLVQGLSWKLCAMPQSGIIRDTYGMRIDPTEWPETLADYDLVVIPGGKGSRERLKDALFLKWLRSAGANATYAAANLGALLLAAAGLLNGRRATTQPDAIDELRAWLWVTVVRERLVEDGRFITSGGGAVGADLGLYLVQKIAGKEAVEQVRSQLDDLLPEAAESEPLPPPRTGQVTRKSRETQIEVEVALDGSGKHEIHTGMGFFDHMLTQIAVHGLFDLKISAAGDLDVDPHHTVEDTALALGEAFLKALGDRSGIVRMASAFTPMDESMARVVVDFSGRPYCVFQSPWTAPEVGALPVTLVAHFFESFAQQARANVHAQALYGTDNHHLAEALFKALGRALASASRVDDRRAGAVPSSKGVLF